MDRNYNYRNRNNNRRRRPTAYFRNYNCKIQDNVIRLENLTNRRLVPEFINSLKRLHFKFNHDKIVIDFEKVGTVYPFPTVPLAGFIHYFREELDVEFEFINVPTYLKKIHFLSPDNIDDVRSIRTENFLDRVWIFRSSDDVHFLVDGFISSIRKGIECEAGVLDACTWGLNEIMDNVIQHSAQNTGFVMGQILRDTSMIKVCIFDYGIGIFKSFQNSAHRPRNASDAISLAIQEGVTRDKKIGQGNGMWGLYNIITQNDGALSIISGKGGLDYRNSNQELRTYQEIILLNKDHQSTMVQFDIKLNKMISIKTALGGHEMIDLYIEDLENEYDQIEYIISEQSSGTGTRQSGQRIRNEVLNIYNTTKKPVIIDFNGIPIISSSFADELIGKLVAQLGLFQFQNIFRLKNMNETIQSIVQRSLSQRLAESLTDPNRVDDR